MSEETQTTETQAPAEAQSETQILEQMLSKHQAPSTEERLYGKKEQALAEAKAESPDLDKAKQVLQRAKLSKEVIGSLSDQQILDQAAVLAEAQADQDRAGNWRDELMKRIEALESGKPSPEEGDDSEEGDEPVAQPSKKQDAKLPDLSEALQPIDEYLYEGIPEAMQNVVGKLVEFNELRMQEVFEQQLAIHNDMMQYVARRELGNEYPQLQDPVAWSKVSKTMQEIAPIMQHDEATTPFERYMRTIKRAAQEVLGFDTGSASMAGDPPSMPVPTRRSSSENSSMSNDERARAYLQARLETGSDSAARRAAGLF